MNSGIFWENMTLWEVFITIAVLEFKIIFTSFFLYSFFKNPKQASQHVKLYITEPYRLMVYMLTGKDRAKKINGV